jgi:ribosomal protein S12 methylthiotransferase accessory factor
MHRMTSSWRSVSLEQTLLRAKQIAPQLGISRVTDVTWLDRIGIPVYNSIRPDAMTGSLCVSAGKGARPLEAQVGAYMEAIEFAMAEAGRYPRQIVRSTPREVAAQAALQTGFVDFCPVWQVTVDPDGPLDCVWAQILASGQRLLVPGELVFSPWPENSGQALFGTNTNGLCSGNRLDEAILHGLCELIERDVHSFNAMQDASLWLNLADAPPTVADLAQKIAAAGMTLAVRYVPNPFGLAHIDAYLMADDDSIPIAYGGGLHLSAQVAMVRAITEAAQSRLSYIHGGRDDLSERAAWFAEREAGVEAREVAKLRQKALNRQQEISCAAVPDHACHEIAPALSLLQQKLAEQQIKQVLYVELSPPESELKVVKVIAPGLECFNAASRRVGPRLHQHLLNLP